MSQPTLLIFYEMVPDYVKTILMNYDDPNYDLISRSNGCYINLNDEKYSDDVGDAVAVIADNILKTDHNAENALMITGSFKIIHCGFCL